MFTNLYANSLWCSTSLISRDNYVQRCRKQNANIRQTTKFKNRNHSPTFDLLQTVHEQRKNHKDEQNGGGKWNNLNYYNNSCVFVTERKYGTAETRSLLKEICDLCYQLDDALNNADIITSEQHFTRTHGPHIADIMAHARQAFAVVVSVCVWI